MNKDILIKKEKEAFKVAKNLNYKITPIFGLIESQDIYEASIEGTEISVYGDSEEEAIKNAINFTTAYFMQNSEELLKARKQLLLRR